MGRGHQSTFHFHAWLRKGILHKINPHFYGLSFGCSYVLWRCLAFKITKTGRDVQPKIQPRPYLERSRWEGQWGSVLVTTLCTPWAHLIRVWQAGTRCSRSHGTVENTAAKANLPTLPSGFIESEAHAFLSVPRGCSYHGSSVEGLWIT